MEIRGFHHVALTVRHLETTAEFYRSVLGLSELARHRRADQTLRSIWLTFASSGDLRAGFLALEEVPGALPKEDEARAGLAALVLAVHRDDRARVRTSLLERGIRIEKETRWTLFFRDPEGNLLGLSHYPADSDVR